MQNERILVVEDEKIISLDLQRRLEKFGYQVVGLSATGTDAVEKARSLLPDIILMDIMLGGDIDGIDAARQIKADLAIPVIFLTAFADEKTLARAKQAEPYGYVLKPFKERELYTTIDIALYKSNIHKKLQSQERWFSGILHSVGDAIIATDDQNNIQFMNPVAETLTGWHEEEAKDLPLSDVFQLFDNHTELRMQVTGEDPKSENEATLFFENVYLKNKQGAQIHVDGTVAAIRSSAAFEGLTIAFRDLTDIKKMSDTIVYQASHDSLTGLVNRTEFIAQLQELTPKVKSGMRSHAILLIDLDQFKVINDVCGHFAGDELLRQVSNDLVGKLPESSIASRMGGDEFAAVLLDTNVDRAVEVARNVHNAVQRRFIWQKNTFNITASLAVVPLEEGNTDVYNVLAAADDACRLAKEKGGNMVRTYETTDHQFLRRRGEMRWISRLTEALEQDRFVLYSQPIAPVRQELRQKAEILIRLREDDGTFANPGEFIPAAERYNLMPYIDRWVVRNILQYEKRTRDSNGHFETYCINLSASSVVDDSFLEFVIRTFEETGAEPHNFTFELTETTAVENLSRAVGFMTRLKKLGVTFALDDFGNGFSSFAYLKNLPVEYLKIDGSYVQDIDRDPIDRAMVEAVNNIGHVMGMRTIAEFVSNSEIRRILEEMGVDYVQGFEIARPGPLSEAHAEVQAAAQSTN
jgi:diguanylate cyclase (GGDEF)-like protein/PAS domain S-box-containing protein